MRAWACSKTRAARRPDAGRGPGARSRCDAPEADGLASALRIPDDPSQLSFLLTGILQVEPFRKQKLLEATTAEQRLRELDLLLDRELMLLRARLAPYSPDRRALGPLAS